jgi:hypothetical protein
MTNARHFREHQVQIARYRALEREVTDPLAARLLHDIVLELEAGFKEQQNASIRAAGQAGVTDAVSFATAIAADAKGLAVKRTDPNRGWYLQSQVEE